MHHRAGCSASVLLAIFAFGCARDTVAHRQPEREANRILVVLRSDGIEAEKTRDPESRDLRFDVTVDPRDAARALALLEAHNLPKPEEPSSRDLVQASGMIPTEREERMKQIVGLEGDIVNALRRVPGVVDVHAAVSVPPSDPLLEPAARPRPKASVLVLARPGAEGLPLSVPDVQRFVQAKLPQLSAREVDVVLLPAGAFDAVAPHPAQVGARCRAARVLTFEVCVGSRRRFVAAAATLGASMLGLALLAWWMAWRSVRTRRALRQLRADRRTEGGAT